MSESKCFCHLNGYEVKDAKSRAEFENLNSILEVDEQTKRSGKLEEIDGNYYKQGLALGRHETAIDNINKDLATANSDIDNVETSVKLLKAVLSSTSSSSNSCYSVDEFLSNIFNGIISGYSYYSNPSEFIKIDSSDSTFKTIELHDTNQDYDFDYSTYEYTQLYLSDYNNGSLPTIEPNKVYVIQESDEYGNSYYYAFICYTAELPTLEYIDNQISSLQTSVSSANTKINNIIQWRDTHNTNKAICGLRIGYAYPEGVYVTDSKSRKFYLVNTHLFNLGNTVKEYIIVKAVPVMTAPDENNNIVQGFVDLRITYQSSGYSGKFKMTSASNLRIPSEGVNETPTVYSYDITNFDVLE